MAFDRLIRFVDEKGIELYGNSNAPVDPNTIVGKSVTVLKGSISEGFSPSGGTAVVGKLLSPLPHTPALICIGLNYRKHAAEVNASVPRDPVVFMKPSTALTGPGEDVHVHSDLQTKLDYEGEVVVVLGKDAKNVKASNALDYVFGYTAGNDVTARDFQVPSEVSGGQFGYSKSFDHFAPTGPCIASTTLISDPLAISYKTLVNGEVRQQTQTDDMIWTIPQLIEHLSRGTTLKAGSLIMTGTPSGVGAYMKPPRPLKHNDVVEVNVVQVGVLRNRIVFD